MNEYQAAGELFGQLADIVKYPKPSSLRPDTGFVVFQWVFTADGKRYSHQEALPLDNLTNSNHLQEHARHLALLRFKFR